MNILLFSDGDSKYGAPHSLVQLIKGLLDLTDDLQITVVLAKNTWELGDQLKLPRCIVIKSLFTPFYQPIPYQKWKYPFKYVIRGLQYHFGKIFCSIVLPKIIDIKSVDLVHSNSSREDMGSIIARKYHKPLVWHIREYGDLDYPCYSYINNPAEYIDKNANMIIAVSDSVKKHWISKGIRSDHIVSIYNGVRDNWKTKTVVKQKVEVLKNDSIKFVMIGSLNPTKGHLVLLEALSLVELDIKKHIYVDIYGDGNYKYTNELLNKIKKYDLGKIVKLNGYKKDVDYLLCNYDIGLMCSRSEAFGRVTAEYMMASLPVIASDSGANPELIRDGVDGFLFKSGQPASLCNTIKAIYHNKDKIPQMGKSARNRALDLFSVETNAKNILNIYEQQISLCNDITNNNIHKQRK